MNDLEKEYVRAYENYLGGLDDLRLIKEMYDEAAMAYFESLGKQTS